VSEKWIFRVWQGAGPELDESVLEYGKDQLWTGNTDRRETAALQQVI